MFIGNMDAIPTLEIGEFRYTPKNKSVLLIYPTGQVTEFSTVEAAQTYLQSALRLSIPGADQCTIFSLENGQWVQVA